MAIKSLVTHVEIDIAGKAHNFQASAKHRIEKGDVRLKVRNSRSWDHYCLNCAKKIIERDIKKLKAIQDRLTAVSQP
ncbi:hypothetical protein [Zymomonas mobilis]|uniref:Uncharacterized protein n=1 Tax=Zymomonas mobilis subsp. mobilis (strain ATCC 31821 / ZM4 / CP4) TaxID=264203 RepID=A0A806CJU8_ZYMMO|nr:hypothetical protein [Zymomonas mobilis]ADC33892.1 hypothetical protein ZZM4_0124 [Zymomonas mobilis subsp. mobilis ZM4 = ATCC 31821]AHB11126.1 hypothetical protein ZCP4_1871 [Zymomonas mobilis subsp. mobilis str. CP4 = NRRL B-14023]AHJ71464.1 hypothetical protein A254_01879 [Zymomonas mobilis subsp. mobilis NRRL B-12526]